jgi:hypothetical protein
VVESLTVVVVALGLVVLEHSDAVLHGVDLIRNTSVVSVLVSQVVQSLSEFSNQLVFLARLDLNTGSL